MTSNRLILTCLMFGLLALAGCSSDTNPPAGPQLTPPSGTRSALDDAPGLLARAASGARVRGEQDNMLRVEAKVAGFGGFYIDSDGAVVIYLKHGPAAQGAAAARAAVYNQYLNRASNVREIMSRALDAQIRVGSYSLSELAAIEQRIGSSPGSIAGLVGWGTSIYKNRVVAGFKDSASMVNGTRSLSRWGIPDSAVIGEVWGEVQLVSSWVNVIRPTRGGVSLAVINRTKWHPAGDSIVFGGGGSLGYNVRTPAGVDYFLTAAHVVNEWSASNGAVGDTVIQPRLGTGSGLYGIGTITVNPAWQQGAVCPERDTVAHIRFEYCSFADAALGSYIGTTGERKIGTSDYQGFNGDPGCCDGHIHGWYTVQGVLAPEFVRQQQDSAKSKGVAKSGFATGTTSGVMGVPYTTVITHLCWGALLNNGCASQPWLYMQGVAQVLTMGVGEGDSGGPVFYGNTQPYAALGIVVGANSINHTYDPPRCTLGSACTTYFARWDEIENLLGLTLNPSTVQ